MSILTRALYLKREREAKVVQEIAETECECIRRNRVSFIKQALNALNEQYSIRVEYFPFEDSLHLRVADIKISGADVCSIIYRRGDHIGKDVLVIVPNGKDEMNFSVKNFDSEFEEPEDGFSGFCEQMARLISEKI